MIALMIQEMKWSVRLQLAIVAIDVRFRILVFRRHGVLLQHDINSIKVLGHIS